MASAIDNIQATINNNATRILNWSAALLEESVNPLPDYSIDGENVSRSAWRRDLMDNISKAVEMNAALYAALIQLEGPTELHVQGTT